jgi:stearoyl-CoA desaturase (Delta-9 desaturase)
MPILPTPTAYPTGIDGVMTGGTRGFARLGSNLLQVGAIHIGAAYAFWHGWEYGVSWIDVSACLIFFAITGIAISLGAHRLFSHRSFVAPPWLRLWLAITVCMAMQGSVGRWATDHVRHHRYPDKAGDPHSPHVTPLGRKLGYWSGMAHSHILWLFTTISTDRETFGKAVWGDPIVKWVSWFHYVWIAFGLVLPWLYGYALGGADAAWSAMLWGGFARAFFVDHAVFSVASISHQHGARDFASEDHSRNGWFVTLLTFGEGWHNNHHKFPRSARLGLLPGQPDFVAWTIERLEQLGIVRGVVRVPQRMIDRERRGYQITKTGKNQEGKEHVQ